MIGRFASFELLDQELHDRGPRRQIPAGDPDQSANRANAGRIAVGRIQRERLTPSCLLN
jgi:hypothetical protein